MKFNYKKILIVGCGGAGKSTLARIMGEKFNLPVIHLDKIHWLPNWQERPNKEFDTLLQNELIKDSWIIDGNYTRTFDARVKYADLCIFLDYPIELCIQSVLERVEQYKNTSRPDMTEGCPEQVDDEFMEWIKNYNIDVRPVFIDTMNKANIPFLIFKSRKETEDWLNSIDNR